MLRRMGRKSEATVLFNQSSLLSAGGGCLGASNEFGAFQRCYDPNSAEHL